MPGATKNTYGTGCFILQHTGAEPVFSQNGLLTTVASRIGGMQQFAVEGSIFIAGAAVQWLRDGLGIIKTAAESEPLARSVPSSDGVYVVPAFAGLGAPHWDMYARGTIVGITRGTTAAHITRATLESIALQTLDVVELMERETGARMPELRVDGGAVANDLLMQIQADVLQRPVVRSAVAETTALRRGVPRRPRCWILEGRSRTVADRARRRPLRAEDVRGRARRARRGLAPRRGAREGLGAVTRATLDDVAGAAIRCRRRSAAVSTAPASPGRRRAPAIARCSSSATTSARGRRRAPRGSSTAGCAISSTANSRSSGSRSHERESLVRDAPHLVRPLRLLVPVYAGDARPGWMVRAGLALYDAMSLRKSLPRHRAMPPRALDAYEPGLSRDGLRAAYTFYDAQVEFPERLVIEAVRDLIDAGGVALNHVACTRLLSSGHVLRGIELREECGRAHGRGGGARRRQRRRAMGR